MFRQLAGEVAVLVDRMNGRPQLRLVDLPRLSDDRLATLMPCLLPGVQFGATARGIVVRRAGRRDALVAVEDGPVDDRTLELFDGRASLGRIADELAAHPRFGGRQEAFAHVRRLFLGLVEVGACVPTNPSGG
jgi:hypothetical protein